MKPRKDFVKEKFDRIVRRYDLVNLIGSFGQDKLWRKKVRQVISQATSPILDLCSGPYTLSTEILKSHQGPLFALDLSFEMLLYGKPRIKDKPIFPLRGDAEVLPFKSNTFGGISIAFGLRNLPNREKALKEFFRVLKSRGILVILEFSFPKNPFVARVYSFYLERYMPFLGGLLTGDKEAYQYLAASIKAFPSPEKVIRMLKKAGFSNVRHKLLSFGIVSLYVAEKS